MKLDAVSILEYLIYGGGSIALFSFVAVYWKWFQGLTAKNAKFWVSSAVSSVISVLAYVVVTYVPATVLAQIDPFIVVIGGVLLMNGFKQVWYDNVTSKIAGN